MPELRKKVRTCTDSRYRLPGIMLLIFLALLLLWFNSANSNQAFSALLAQVRFYGEYRIGDGPWQEIEEGRHIPATKGDVTLRGNFHTLTPDGEYVGIYSGDIPIAFYTDHISLTLYEGEKGPYLIDMENPLFGNSACGEGWTAHLFTVGSEEPIEIRSTIPIASATKPQLTKCFPDWSFGRVSILKGAYWRAVSPRETPDCFL